jgi:hypothetical protein
VIDGQGRPMFGTFHGPPVRRMMVEG